MIFKARFDGVSGASLILGYVLAGGERLCFAESSVTNTRSSAFTGRLALELMDCLLGAVGWFLCFRQLRLETV